ARWVHRDGVCGIGAAARSVISGDPPLAPRIRRIADGCVVRRPAVALPGDDDFGSVRTDRDGIGEVVAAVVVTTYPQTAPRQAGIRNGGIVLSRYVSLARSGHDHQGTDG